MIQYLKRFEVNQKHLEDVIPYTFVSYATGHFNDQKSNPQLRAVINPALLHS